MGMEAVNWLADFLQLECIQAVTWLDYWYSENLSPDWLKVYMGMKAVTWLAGFYSEKAGYDLIRLLIEWESLTWRAEG